MTSLELLELTSEELAGQQPEAGTELTIRGKQYHIVEATPPVIKPLSKWRRKQTNPVTPKWRLLVRTVE